MHSFFPLLCICKITINQNVNSVPSFVFGHYDSFILPLNAEIGPMWSSYYKMDVHHGKVHENSEGLREEHGTT
jgi:hypothetical protein